MCDYCGCIEALDRRHEAEDEKRVSDLLQRGVIVVDDEEGKTVRDNITAAALIAAFSGNALNNEIERVERKAFKPTKQCLECGKDHKHNNSWCSAGCCETWRLKENQL